MGILVRLFSQKFPWGNSLYRTKIPASNGPIVVLVPENDQTKKYIGVFLTARVGRI